MQNMFPEDAGDGLGIMPEGLEDLKLDLDEVSLLDLGALLEDSLGAAPAGGAGPDEVAAAPEASQHSLSALYRFLNADTTDDATSSDAAAQALGPPLRAAVSEAARTPQGPVALQASHPPMLPGQHSPLSPYAAALDHGAAAGDGVGGMPPNAQYPIPPSFTGNGAGAGPGPGFGAGAAGFSNDGADGAAACYQYNDNGFRQRQLSHSQGQQHPATGYPPPGALQAHQQTYAHGGSDAQAFWPHACAAAGAQQPLSACVAQTPPWAGYVEQTEGPCSARPYSAAPYHTLAAAEGSAAAQAVCGRLGATSGAAGGLGAVEEGVHGGAGRVLGVGDAGPSSGAAAMDDGAFAPHAQQAAHLAAQQAQLWPQAAAPELVGAGHATCRQQGPRGGLAGEHLLLAQQAEDHQAQHAARQAAQQAAQQAQHRQQARVPEEPLHDVGALLLALQRQGWTQGHWAAAERSGRALALFFPPESSLEPIYVPAHAGLPAEHLRNLFGPSASGAGGSDEPSYYFLGPCKPEQPQYWSQTGGWRKCRYVRVSELEATRLGEALSAPGETAAGARPTGVASASAAGAVDVWGLAAAAAAGASPVRCALPPASGGGSGGGEGRQARAFETGGWYLSLYENKTHCLLHHSLEKNRCSKGEGGCSTHTVLCGVLMRCVRAGPPPPDRSGGGTGDGGGGGGKAKAKAQRKAFAVKDAEDPTGKGQGLNRIELEVENNGPRGLMEMGNAWPTLYVAQPPKLVKRASRGQQNGPAQAPTPLPSAPPMDTRIPHPRLQRSLSDASCSAPAAHAAAAAAAASAAAAAAAAVSSSAAAGAALLPACAAAQAEADAEAFRAPSSNPHLVSADGGGALPSAAPSGGGSTGGDNGGGGSSGSGGGGRAVVAAEAAVTAMDTAGPSGSGSGGTSGSGRPHAATPSDPGLEAAAAAAAAMDIDAPPQAEVNGGRSQPPDGPDRRLRIRTEASSATASGQAANGGAAATTGPAGSNAGPSAGPPGPAEAEGVGVSVADADAEKGVKAIGCFLGMDSPEDYWDLFLRKELPGPDGKPSLLRVLAMRHGHERRYGILNIVLHFALKRIPYKSEVQLRRELAVAEGLPGYDGPDSGSGSGSGPDRSHGTPLEEQVDASGPEGIAVQKLVVRLYERLFDTWPGDTCAAKQLLLQQDMDWQDTALHTCCRHGLLHLLGWLLAHPACDAQVLTASTKDGWTPLLTACRSKQLPAAVRLLERARELGVFGPGVTVRVGERHVPAAEVLLSDPTPFNKHFRLHDGRRRLERALELVWPDPAGRPAVCSGVAADSVQLKISMEALASKLADVKLAG